MVVDRLVHLIDSVASIAEIDYFDVKFGIEENILTLDVTVGYSFGVDIFEGLDDLFKDASSHFF